MIFAHATLAVLGAAAVILTCLWQGPAVAAAALYGLLIALVNVGLLAWRWQRGRYLYHCDGARHLKQFHRSSLERFFVVIIMLAAGMFGLKLKPLFLLLGFIVGQIALVIFALS